MKRSFWSILVVAMCAVIPMHAHADPPPFSVCRVASPQGAWTQRYPKDGAKSPVDCFFENDRTGAAIAVVTHDNDAATIEEVARSYQRKHIAEGHLTSVITVRSDPNGTYARFTVADKGNPREFYVIRPQGSKKTFVLLGWVDLPYGLRGVPDMEALVAELRIVPNAR